MPDGRRTRSAVAALLVVTAALGVFWLVRTALTPLGGPVPVPLDRVRCVRCGMLVSDLGFAGQIHTADGEVLHFDDPGCLLLHAHDQASEDLTLYFHHATEDRWLTGDEVRFAPAEATPMAYGLGAVGEESAGTLDREAALAQVLALDGTRRGP